MLIHSDDCDSGGVTNCIDVSVSMILCRVCVFAADFVECWDGERSPAVGRAVPERAREQLQSVELYQWHAETVAARAARV